MGDKSPKSKQKSKDQKQGKQVAKDKNKEKQRLAKQTSGPLAKNK